MRNQLIIDQRIRSAIEEITFKLIGLSRSYQTVACRLYVARHASQGISDILANKQVRVMRTLRLLVALYDR